jgi:hypothetical protein
VGAHITTFPLIAIPCQEVIYELVEVCKVHQMHWTESLPEEFVAIRKLDLMLLDVRLVKLIFFRDVFIITAHFVEEDLLAHEGDSTPHIVVVV